MIKVIKINASNATWATQIVTIEHPRECLLFETSNYTLIGRFPRFSTSIARIFSLCIVIFNTSLLSFFHMHWSVETSWQLWYRYTRCLCSPLQLERFERQPIIIFMVPLLSRPSINSNVLVSPSSSPHERVKYDRKFPRC